MIRRTGFKRPTLGAALEGGTFAGLTTKKDSLTSRIVLACTGPRGASMSEITTATGGHPPSVNATVPLLVRKGKLHRVGTRMVMRYFAHAAHAQAYQVIFQAERAVALAQRLQRRRDYYNAKNAERRAARPPKPKAPPKPKKPRRQAARPPRAPKHGRAITIGRSKRAGLEQLDQAATVTWPEHVQVQRAPVRLDTRFTFTPPPGWLGEFGREWQERRAGA